MRGLSLNLTTAVRSRNRFFCGRKVERVVGGVAVDHEVVGHPRLGAPVGVDADLDLTAAQDPLLGAGEQGQRRLGLRRFVRLCAGADGSRSGQRRETGENDCDWSQHPSINSGVGRRFTGSGAQMSDRLDEFMAGLVERNPGEHEFHQAVREVYADVIDEAYEDERTRRAGILERMTEPDRSVIFRVTWETDDGELRSNRAYRVQFNNSLGPYKGGLRFVGGLEFATLKFLGFEQTFKNALTGLPMGGAKGGSDFSPKGKSDAEVMRFCQSMMLELHRHIGEDVDVPAGDIGVGEREIAYLFGQYKRLENRFAGVLTGKGMSFGGSAGRSEATGYGVGYFTALMLERADDELEGKRCAISGAGNVSIFCAEKLIDLGAVVVSLSDSDGTVHDPDGIDAKKLDFVKDLKLERRGRIAEYAEEFGCEYLEGETPWGLECDLAFPCATQNELEADDARRADRQRLPGGGRGREHAAHGRCHRAPARGADRGWAGEGGERRWRGRFGTRAEPERRACFMVARRPSTASCDEIMERIHAECAERGEREDGIDRLRARSQPRRLRAGPRGDARLRRGLAPQLGAVVELRDDDGARRAPLRGTARRERTRRGSRARSRSCQSASPEDVDGADLLELLRDLGVGRGLAASTSTSMKVPSCVSHSQSSP